MGSSAELSSESESAGSPNLEDTIEALKKKAHAALSDAEVLSKEGSPEATINRRYYTVFQAARAALLTEEESPNTHSGFIRENLSSRNRSLSNSLSSSRPRARPQL